MIELVKQAGMSIIICPSAALSMKQLDMVAPLHNSIAPFPKAAWPPECRATWAWTTSTTYSCRLWMAICG